MPILQKRFIRREVTFPRSTVSSNNLIPDPTDDVFQLKAIRFGPHTILTQNFTEFRTTPRRFVAPTKSGTTGGVSGIRRKSIT